MSNSTKITIKRSTLEGLEISADKELYFGEPLIIDTDQDDYLVIGASGTNGSTSIVDSIFFRGLTLDQANHQVTYIWNSNSPGYEIEEDIGVLTTLNDSELGNAGTYLKVKRVSTDDITNLSDLSEDDAAKKYYILCQDIKTGRLKKFMLGGEDSDIGIYIDGKGIMHGAAWNDYAENRHFKGTEDIDEIAGHVVCEDGKGNLVLSTERLQPCSYVVSDTYGMTIGEGNVHVAVAGKALVCVDDHVDLGDCITAGENGIGAKMSRPEIINYPDRILGVVVEVPENNEGKVWVKIN
jgi:hypothetical protein